jgi:hypothetical protein
MNGNFCNSGLITGNLGHREVYASGCERVVLHECQVSLLLSDRAMARSPVMWGEVSLSAEVCVEKGKRAGLLSLPH